MKVKFERVTIKVKNLEKAVDFFSDLLETTFDIQPEEPKHEFTPAPDAYTKCRAAISPIGIELFEPDPVVEEEGVWNMTWRVDDLEKAKEDMREKGIRHLFDIKCGRWKETVYSPDDMYGVRWDLDKYEGDSAFKAMLRK